MKIRLEDAGSFGYLRCPNDDKLLLKFQDDDVVLENCEHFKWHLAGDNEYEGVSNNDEEDASDNDEEDWDEIVRQNHVAAVEVQNGKFYLIPVKNAVEK